MAYLETTTGWIFAVKQNLGIIFVALEPLPPIKSFSDQDFILAVQELESHFQQETIAWVAIGDRFISLLSQLHYEHLLVGEEPWIDLAHYAPTGKKSRGIRAARNQAIRAHASTEKWKISDLKQNPHLKTQVDQIHEQWKQKTLVSMEGFLLKTDPWALSDERWCFIAKNHAQKVEAVLIATKIVKKESWYLEDLWLGYEHTRGIGELLMLDAMEGLKNLGAREVSMGVVALKELRFSEPSFFSKMIFILEKTFKTFYNAQGIALFRKRFNVAKWTPTYISIKPSSNSKSISLTWLQVIVGLAFVFEPHLYLLNFKSLWQALRRKLFEHPISIGFALITGSLFAYFNHFGVLPESVLRHYSFDLQAPWYEWFYRTFTSDFLFFDRAHFIFLYPLYCALLYILEKKQKLKFVFGFFILTHFFDDFINYFFIVKPFHFLRATLYFNLVSFKDVGCSLGMVTALGFLVNTQLRRIRELVLILVAIGLVFGYAFHSLHFSAFILNLNHFLFFLIGYLIGKIKFEMMRAENKKLAKKKSPDRTKFL